MSKEKSQGKKNVKRVEVKPATVMDRNEFDMHVIDLVLNTLYNNSDKDVFHLDDEIYKPAKVTMPIKESDRLWEVMVSSGLINPVIGFGNSGKIELSSSGYQLMAKYGGYLQYMASVNSSSAVQSVEFPEQEAPEKDCQEVTADNKEKGNEIKKSKPANDDSKEEKE